MKEGRRGFIKRIGSALVAAASPALVGKASGFRESEGADGLEPFVEIAGGRISGEKAIAAKGLRVNIEKAAYPNGTRYNLTITKTSRSAPIVDRVGLALRGPKSGPDASWRVFLDIGHSGWCGVKRLDALEPDPQLQPVRRERARPFHRSDLQAVVWNATSGEAILAGFLRQRYGANKVDVIPSHPATNIERLEAWQEFGFDFAPGKVQALDPLVTSRSHDPYALLEAFGAGVREYHGRSFNDPPIVGMMTWYGYRISINEDMVLANAGIISDLFSGYPQKMQNIMICDHGWQEDANWGYWEPDQKRFPHGMKWLAEQLEKKGVSLGLWYTAFCLTHNAPNYKELVRLEALGKDGKPRTSTINVWGNPGPPWAPHVGLISFFDGAKEAAQKMWAKVLERMKAWGVVYWKLDFFSLQTSAANESKLGLGELYARTWKTFRQAVGGLKLNPCSCRSNLQIGYADSVRIAADIGNAGSWPGTMKAFRFAMGTIIGLWYKNRKFWINDPDSIQFAKGCSFSEARVRATVVALSGGHFMLSEDLREVEPERIEMIRRLIPPCPQAARPLDLFENPRPGGYPTFWALRLETGLGRTTTLAVFNLDRESRQYEITPQMLGIEAGKEFLAFEWWQCRWLGRFQSNFKVEVPAEDVMVIHAQPTQDVPSLLSVSHHVTGGYIVEDAMFDRQSGTLSGVLVTKPGLRMVLFGHLPERWKLAYQTTLHGTLSSVGGWQYEVVTTAERSPFKVWFSEA